MKTPSPQLKSQPDTRAGAEGALALPASLARQLVRFERRLCLMESVVALFGGCCGLLLTYVVLFVSDRVWNTPAWLRGPLTLGGGITLGLCVYWWLHHWWWRRRDTKQLAQLVQKQYGRLGDRLLGVVELVNSAASERDGSPALCRAAIRQVALEAETLNFSEAVPTQRPRRLSIAFLAMCAIIAAAVLLSPQAGLNALLRWMKPLSTMPRYTFVSLDALPRKHVVAHGEAFELVCGIAESSRWRPTKAVCRIEGQPQIEVEAVDSQVVFQIPAQTAEGVLALRIGDAVKQMTIVPVFRPELLALTSEVTLPVYLQRPVQTNAVKSGQSEFLEGSTVHFVGVVNRTLASAALDGGMASPLTVAGNRFTSDATAVTERTRCQFAWVDHHGLAGAAPYEVAIEVVKDALPTVECRGLRRIIAVLQDEVVELAVHAEDDYGLRELWVAWSSHTEGQKGEGRLRGTRILAKGSPSTGVLDETFTFSPLAAQIPEESMVTLCAYAADYLAGRQAGKSLVYQIYVLSKAQHAKLIQEQMEAIQSGIEDLARDEEQLLEANRALEKLPPDAMQSDQQAAALKAKALTERSHARRLKEFERESQELLKEALRNKDVDAKTLARWAELTASMGKLAAGEMKQSSQLLQQAASSKSQRADKLKEAIATEEKILEALRAMERKLNTSIQEMLAQSFVNRLLAAAASEQEIAGALRAIVPATIGMETNTMPREVLVRLQQCGAQQRQTRQQADDVQDDLVGFFQRTRIEIYGEVHDAMRDRKMSSRLEALAATIDMNHCVTALGEVAMWEQQFRDWAEQLKKKGGGGCGSGGGKEPTEAEIEVLLALMRARSREEALRENTRVLDRERGRDYTSQARRLAELQAEIGRETRQLQAKVTNAKLRQLIEKVSGEMVNVALLLRRPQTDAETIAIETEIIELLSGCMSSCSGSSGAMGQMMMQTMGMSTGSAGQGSQAGGMTDRSNSAATGSAVGDPDGARGVEKASGGAPSELPIEFKRKLEAYFEALEESP